MNPQALNSIAALRGLDENVRAQLAAVLQETVSQDGQVIYAEGDRAGSMFFILSGSVRFEKQWGADSSARKTVGILEAGDYFGDYGLLDESPRPVTTTSVGLTHLAKLARPDFEALLKDGHQSGVRLLLSMLQTSGDRVRMLASMVFAYDEVGRAIGNNPPVSVLLQTVLDQLVLATRADWSLALLRAQFSDQLEVRAVSGLDLAAKQLAQIGDGKGFLRSALGLGEARLIRDFESEDAVSAAEKLGFETPAMLWVPIIVADQSLGLIVLGGLQPGQFSHNNLHLAGGIASQAAQAILNARHREEETARRRHAEQRVGF